MTNVLIVAEHSAGTLRRATRQALSAGRILARRAGGSVHVVVLGKEVATVAEQVAALGVEVHVADAPGLEHALAVAWAPVIADLARRLEAGFVCAAATSQGKDILPRVAARLGAGMASDVVGFGGEGDQVTFHRPMWAGNVMAEVEIATAVKALTVRPSEFPEATAEGAGRITPLPVPADACAAGTRRVEFREVRSARPELTEAQVVVSGGRGTKGDFKPIEALADALGGAVGASRAAVDAGWVPNSYQVGQTGKVVAPDLYFAVGISGAIQHVAGMKGSRLIVAINKDPEAPIFQVADLGLVGDLAVAVPELLARMGPSR